MRVHTGTHRRHTNKYEYIRVTYESHTSTYESHTGNIRIQTGKISKKKVKKYDSKQGHQAYKEKEDQHKKDRKRERMNE